MGSVADSLVNLIHSRVVRGLETQPSNVRIGESSSRLEEQVVAKRSSRRFQRGGAWSYLLFDSNLSRVPGCS